MRKNKKEELLKDPMTAMFASIEKIGWTVLIPFPDRKRDAVYGMLIGENAWVDLVRSYLPKDFEKIVEEKLKLSPVEGVTDDNFSSTLKESVEQGVDHAKQQNEENSGDSEA